MALHNVNFQTKTTEYRATKSLLTGSFLSCQTTYNSTALLLFVSGKLLTRKAGIIMSGFSEVTLSQKLAELNHTQPSIQGLSLWLLHHRKHYQSIVKVTPVDTTQPVSLNLPTLGLVQGARERQDGEEAGLHVPGQ